MEEDKGIHKADIQDEPVATAEEKAVSPCQCCGEIECRLPTNEWTDD